MSKQAVFQIAQVLSAFEGMGATEEQLEAERRLMEIDSGHLAHNMLLIGDGADESIEEALEFMGVI